MLGLFLVGLALPSLAVDLSRSGADGQRPQALDLTHRAPLTGRTGNKTASGTMPFELSGDMGVSVTRLRGSATVWTTPVAVEAVQAGDAGSTWRFGAGTDGWTRVSGGERVSGFGDLQLSVTRAFTMLQDTESYATAFAVVPGSRAVGSPGSGWGFAAGAAAPLSDGRHWLLVDVSWSKLRLDPSSAGGTGMALAKVGLTLTPLADHTAVFDLGLERGGGTSTRLASATYVVPLPLSPTVQPDLALTWAGSHQEGRMDSAVTVSVRLAF